MAASHLCKDNTVEPNNAAVERNMRFLVIEIFWAAIFTGSVSFNAAYLIRLGGSNLLVGLLTAGAALVNVFATIPFAALLERRANRRPWIVGSLAAVRAGYLGLVLVPLLPEIMRPSAMVLWLIVLNVPSALFVAGFTPMLADLVPIHRRARVFAARNIALGATVTVCTFVMGYWLDLAPFPFNYQVIYTVGVIASAISTIYVARLTIPDSEVVPRALPRRRSLGDLLAITTRQRPFVNMLFNTLLFNLAVWMALPLQPIYFVRELGASDGWIGLWLGVVSAGTILGNLIWQRLIDRRGAGWALLRTTILSSIYFFLIGLFPDLNLILLFALLAGLINPGVDLSHLNVLFEICPRERRAMYLSVFIAVMNFGLFVSALVVAPLADMIGAQALVLALGVMRLIGAALFTINPVRPPVEPIEAMAQ